jgi:hypothetical protein
MDEKCTHVESIHESASAHTAHNTRPESPSHGTSATKLWVKCPVTL